MFFGWVGGQSMPVVSSHYVCAGKDPDGKAYTLPLEIETRKDNYFLTWGDGGMIGMGFVDDGALVAVLVHRESGSLGVVNYHISPGQLTGRWAAGDGMIYNETCMVGTAAEHPTIQA